jgi:vancomycin aglycone glucosyltransferase
VALALQLRALGHEARLCVPPDFRAWIEGFGFPVTPIGPEVRTFAAAQSRARLTAAQNLTAQPAAQGTAPAIPSPEQRRAMIEATVATQFDTIAEAARDCDAILAATALQIAARSIAERRGIPYTFAAYSATVLPSPHHPPPALPTVPGESLPPTLDNRELWSRDTARFNDTFGEPLNRQRALLGLSPVQDVRSYMFTEAPWLAADPVLGPWPDDHVMVAGSRGPAGPAPRVVQTGAWILFDERPLSRELEVFLDAGAPPLYFGFGSTAASTESATAMLRAARAVGRRVIVSRGWFDESLVEDQADCLAIGDANLLALFPRVAAVVHHGGAGTTTAAALGGAPQVVVSHRYDQHYWAGRVAALGIGVSLVPDAMSAESLTLALEKVLSDDVAARARSIAPRVRRDGVAVAAQRVVSL